MGYFLLWLENLSLSLLLTATLLACIGRLQGPRIRSKLRTTVIVVLLLVYLGFVCPAGAMELGRQPIKLGLFYPFLMLMVCYGLSAIWLGWNALQPAVDEPPTVTAARWPRGKLAIALAVVFVLHVLTFMNIDAAVQQRMVGIRAEATTLALSVAPERVPDRDNALFVYQEAFNAMGPWQEWHDNWGNLLERLESQDDWQPIDPKNKEISGFVDANRGAILLLCEAADKPACSFDRDYGRPRFDTLLPEVDRIRPAMTLLTLDARRKAASGDSRGALAEAQAMFRIAEHFSEEPFLFGTRVAVLLDGRACETLECVLNAAPVSGDELSEIEIEPTFSFHRFFDRALRMEEAAGLWIMSTIGGQVPLNELAAILQEGPSSQVPGIGIDAFYRVFLLGDDLEAFRTAMHDVQPRIMQSYVDARKRSQGVETKITEARPGVLTPMIFPAILKSQESAAKGDARRRAARVGLAVHRYQAKHGKLPEKLDDLVAEFLPVVPRDPFNDKPLRYKTTDTGAIVYSIGPDLKDDGGTRLDKTSTGDLVFEIRRQKPE